MAAVDLSWLPAGTHDVILGKTLSNALKARNGEPIPGSIVGKEFYTSLYSEFQPSSDMTGTIEFTHGEGGKMTSQVERSHSNKADTHVYAGAEANTSEGDCVLIYDQESGEITIEKIDKMFRFSYSNRIDAPLSTPSPAYSASGGRASSAELPAEHTIRVAAMKIQEEDDEEGELSEDEPLVQQKLPPKRKPSPPSIFMPASTPSSSVKIKASKASVLSEKKKAPRVRQRSPPSVAEQITPVPVPAPAAKAKVLPKPRPKPVVKKVEPAPAPPAPMQLALPGSGSADFSLPGSSSHPAFPGTSASTYTKPISVASAAMSEDDEDIWDEITADVQPQSTTNALEASGSTFPPPPRQIMMVEVDADDMDDANHVDDDFLAEMFGGEDEDEDGDEDEDEDDMEEVAPEGGANTGADEEEEDFLAAQFSPVDERAPASADVFTSQNAHDDEDSDEESDEDSDDDY